MDESGRRIILRKQEAEVGGFGVIRIMAFCFLMRWEDGGHYWAVRGKSGQMIQYTIRKIHWLVV